MKIVALLLIMILTALSSAAFADEYVNGYYRRDGTYVQPYMRSSPNGTVTDNYSFEGNVNPYTGKAGTNRYEHDETSPYFEGPDNQGRIGHNNDRDDSDSSDRD